MSMVYQYQDTIKRKYQSWFLFQFLVKKKPMYMYFISKIVPILLLAFGYTDTWIIFLCIICFFYGDLLLLNKYNKTVKVIESKKDTENHIRIELKREAMVYFSPKRTKTVLFGTVSKIRKTKRFYIVYKDKEVLTRIYVAFDTEDEKQVLEDYFKLQLERYPRIKQTGFRNNT